jgi:two-component system, NarL family, nitrate/nitrite response regulator NarL
LIGGIAYTGNMNLTGSETLVYPTSVLIADDHRLLAEAVAAALEAPPRSFKTTLASDLHETLAALKTGEKFDLVLLDVRMPGMLGLKSIKDVIAAASPSYVCLMSGNVDRPLTDLSVESGARGMIPKTLSIKALISVVEFVLSGQVFIPADQHLVSSTPKTKGATTLSDKETSIIRLTSEGRTNKEIAVAIGSSEVTVKMHMRSICSKLGARNRAHAVDLCRQRGLI